MNMASQSRAQTKVIDVVVMIALGLECLHLDRYHGFEGLASKAHVTQDKGSSNTKTAVTALFLPRAQLGLY